MAAAVSVIIVTWNGLHLLRPCLEGLRHQTVDHELIIVDNGSTDGTADWIKEAHPAICLYRLSTNLGFAGGNNVGLRAARGDLLVLLNNDTLVPPTFLGAICEPMLRHADLGSVAGVLTFAHRPEVVASAGIEPGRDLVHRDARMLTPTADLPTTNLDVFGASGGAACFRRDALEDVGLFAEHFFNYLEDADLAWRLRLRNWRCVLAPLAHVRHVYSATSGAQSPWKQRLLARNRWWVMIRCVPDALLRQCLIQCMRYEILTSVFSLATNQPAILQGRCHVLPDIPRLLRERRAILARRVASDDVLSGWLQSAPGPRKILQDARRLHSILADRSPS